jgi:hypothetical protein
VILEFPYLSEALRGMTPPTLTPGARHRLRPFIPIRIAGSGPISIPIRRALVDSGADDTVFPLAVAQTHGIALRNPTPFHVVWRGAAHPLWFARATLRLEAGIEWLQWTSTIAFSHAPIRYPILGIAGCIEYFDVTFLGSDQQVVLQPNRLFPGVTS